jgi:hypothetical protein
MRGKLRQTNRREGTMAETMATIQRKAGDNAMEAIHESEREWGNASLSRRVEQDDVPSST